MKNKELEQKDWILNSIFCQKLYSKWFGRKDGFEGGAVCPPFIHGKRPCCRYRLFDRAWPGMHAHADPHSRTAPLMDRYGSIRSIKNRSNRDHRDRLRNRCRDSGHLAHHDLATCHKLTLLEASCFQAGMEPFSTCVQNKLKEMRTSRVFMRESDIF